MYRIIFCAAALLLLCAVSIPVAAGDDGYEPANQGGRTGDRTGQSDTIDRNGQSDTTDRGGYERANRGRRTGDRTRRPDTPDREGRSDTTDRGGYETANPDGGRIGKGDSGNQADTDDAAACGKASGDAAIAACSRVLQRNPNDTVAFKRRGLAYAAQGNDDGAIEDFGEAIRLDPNDASTFVDRAAAYDRKGDHERTLADLDEAIRLDPKNAARYISRGVAYEHKGDYDRAIADYDQAVTLDPHSSNAYNSRGFARFLRGEYDGAYADADEAIRLDPKNAYAWGTRGEALLGKAEYDRAIADLDRCIQLDPNIADSYSDRGLAYAKRDRPGDRERAMSDLNKGLALNSKLARGYGYRAAVYELRGETDRALGDAEEALRLDPNDAFAYGVRGRVWFDKGQYDRAIADLDKALRLNPNLAEASENRDLTRAALTRRTPPPAAVTPPPAAPPPVAVSPPPAAPPPVAVTPPPVAPPPVAAVTPPPAPPPPPQRRVALVIGNSAYRTVPALPNPKRDAEAVAEALRLAGFQTVDLATDLSRDAMVKALKAFRARADHADWALIYFAGHGIEIDRVNYLIPIDAQLDDERDVKTETVSYEDVLNAATGARMLRLLMLDACRINPFKDRMHRSIASRSQNDRGLAAPPETQPGTLVIYSAKEGTRAEDDVDGRNSPFARAFVTQLKVPGREVRRLFDYVRDDVLQATSSRQQPYTYGSLPAEQDFFFVPAR